MYLADIIPYHFETENAVIIFHRKANAKQVFFELWNNFSNTKTFIRLNDGLDSIEYPCWILSFDVKYWSTFPSPKSAIPLEQSAEEYVWSLCVVMQDCSLQQTSLEMSRLCITISSATNIPHIFSHTIFQILCSQKILNKSNVKIQ